MDDNARRRRQEQASNSSTSRYLISDPNSQRRQYGIAGPERYRHTAAVNTSAPGPRSMGGAASYSGYYQEPGATFSQSISQSTIAYPPEYAHDSRQTQGYSAYNSMLYNVPQSSAQSAVYDTNQFPSRQSASLQMLGGDVPTPYYQGEPTNAAATAGLQQQAASSSTAAVYQQNTPDQRILQQSYPSTMAPMSVMEDTESEQIAEDEDYTTEETVPAADLTEAYERYQDALRDIFSNIQNGALQAASESLLTISEWLLSKVVDLGLTKDEESLHQDRIKLWRDFNHAWLSLCQKQKDMLESDSPLQRDQDILSEEQLKKMGHELVRLCNGIERHGLVDYEYGVWEELIIDILGKCLDAYEYGRR